MSMYEDLVLWICYIGFSYNKAQNNMTVHEALYQEYS